MGAAPAPVSGRPGALAGCALVGGLAAAMAVGLPACWAASAATAAALCAAVIRPRLAPVAILCALAAAGAWRVDTTRVRVTSAQLRATGVVEGRLVIASDVVVRGPSFECLARPIDLRASAADVEVEVPVLPLVRLRWARQSSAPIDFGDTVYVRGLLQPVGGLYAAAGSRRYWERHGVAASLWALAPGPRVGTPAAGWSPGHLAARARRAATASFVRMLGERHGAVLTGVVLGSVTAIPEDLSEYFRVTGTVHVLACSGANVGLVAGLAATAGALLGLRRRPLALLILLAVVAYTLVAGSKPSVVRAMIMAAGLLAPALLDREPDEPTSLSLAAAGIGAWDPGHLWDPGFQLSFTIVAFLLLARPWIGGLFSRVLPRPADRRSCAGAARSAAASVIGGILVTTVAHAAATPLVAQHFNQVSLVGLLANAAVVPLAGLALIGGALLAPASAVFPGAATLAGAWLLGPVIAAMEACVRWCAAIPWASLNVVSPSWPVVIAAYLALGLALHRAARHAAQEVR
ncbi:MAG TPA: ComEC/Rec2 family competence protein [Chthonomonadales bacterium]|nr:ComEC/Rec2 family competence protein [Chthonomonadales bacterium]